MAIKICPNHLAARLAVLSFVSLACLGSLELSAFGQELSQNEIENLRSIVRNRIESDDLVGVAVCVIDKGKTVFCQAFGYADMNSKRALTTDTPFQLASLSKQFASTSVMLLVKDGKLRMDDEIGSHLKEIPNDWKEISVRQLLAHTSGIKDYAKFPNIREDYQKDLKRDAMLGQVFSYPLDFEPGAKFSYSNSGYTIVGCLIEKVSGKDYGTFLQNRIFDPLDMKTARLEPIQNKDSQRAIGHQSGANEHRPANYNSPTWAFAAGGIVGSINDLAKWDAGIDGNVLLTAEQQRILWTEQVAGGKGTEFGLGWMLKPAPGGKRFALHFGGKPGFSAAIARLVEDRLTIAVLSNVTAGRSSKILEEIGQELLSNRRK